MSADRPHILVVEDEAPIVELLRYNLETSGYSVSVATDGDEALELVAEDQPDAVLLDWMLPRKSGIEVCRQLRAKAGTRMLPIILLTARGEEADRVRGLDTGADDYIVKPFSPKELEARLKAVLRRAHPALVEERLEYRGIAIDLARHRVFAGRAQRPSGPDGIPPAADPAGTADAGVQPLPAARRRLGPGRLCRGAHGGRPYPPPAQGAQRRRRTRRHPHRALRRLRARPRPLNRPAERARRPDCHGARRRNRPGSLRTSSAVPFIATRPRSMT